MGGRTWPLRLEVATLRVGEVVVLFGRGQGHRESKTAGTLSLPRPIPVLNSNNIAQPSAR